MSIETQILVVFSILTAIAFDLINGFHDAANSIATVVSTRVLKPHTAVIWAAFFNFIAMLVFAPKVAETISRIVRVEVSDLNYVGVVLMGLVSAIVWDLVTWWRGLPTSSSHALIGGFAGAGVAYGGWEVLRWEKLIDIIIFLILAPLFGFILGAFLMGIVFWFFHTSSPVRVNSLFRKGQLLSAAMYSMGHGANDAQKTMGIILAILISAGIATNETELSLADSKTAWVIIVCHAAIAIGTALGGWRIVKTMGQRITKLKPMGGFCAETAGALTLFGVSAVGIPVSTTHTITGAVVGVGSLNHKFSSVKWGVAARIVWAWIFTIPVTFLFAALLYMIWQRL